MTTDAKKTAEPDYGELGEAFAAAQQPGGWGSGATPAPQPPAPNTPDAAAPKDSNATSDGNPDVIANVPVYLPPELRQRLRDESRRQGVTITDVVLDAFETHGANYARLTITKPAVPGGPPRRKSGRNRDSVQIQLRFTSEQRRWIDTTVQHQGAPTRSALVTAVLRRHLSPV